MKAIFLLLSCVLLFPACLSKQLEKEKYDKVFEASHKRLIRHHSSKYKNWYFLTESYQQAQKKDSLRAAWLHQQSDGERWLELVVIYQRMKQRQQRLQPLLPLPEAVDFPISNTVAQLESLYQNTMVRAGSFLKARAEKRGYYAQKGDKVAARLAYNDYKEALTYIPEESEQLNANIEEMKELGTVRVQVDFSKVGRQSYNDRTFQSEFLKTRKNPWKKDWLEIYFYSPLESVAIDYWADVIILEVDVSRNI